MIPSWNARKLYEAFRKHTPKTHNQSQSCGQCRNCISARWICMSKRQMLQFRDNAALVWYRLLDQRLIRPMVIKVAERERATILAALRRWLSYPAAREADSTATCRGKHKPLDDGEIQRLCKRISEMERRGKAAPLRHHSSNGADDNTNRRQPSIRASGLQRPSRPKRG